MLGASIEQITAARLPAFLRTPAGSATASRGVLAVAAACGSAELVDPAMRYLKEWYGQRAAQGRALIEMLAWVDDPRAVQAVLSVAARFRTKGLQEEAARQATALAERHGWTVSELSDRTIPTGGLDDDGVLELSYGDRTFTAVLLPDLSLELHNPEGGKISALPAARQSDDEAAVKESKKALTAARKQLKSLAQQQTERLYEALCTGRSWSGDDWQRYLNGHPIVRHLTQRLVWVATGPDDTVTVFRPLDDGTLTDADDNEVTLPTDARVMIAHDSVLDPDPDTAAQWQTHLEDYEIMPLFQQLGKGVFALPAEHRDEREVLDVQGHLVQAFALRGRATKLGYVRGAAEDAGWFYTYEKRYPTLDLAAVVTFTGNPLPEVDRTVALESLTFERRESTEGAPHRAARLTLGEVPAVLLSEAYQDLRLMASDGPGFHPDWQTIGETL